jgi:REP element-mobilizing transposase RayT
MAKPRQENPEGGMYHAFGRGNEKQVIFRDDEDRQRYLMLLARVVKEKGWQVLAFCLMTNHVHLVVATRAGNLGDGMQLLHGEYVKYFNRKYKRVGHLFNRPFKSVEVEDDVHACMTIRYVARNPVEAGLCVKPEDWAWSSCRVTLERRGYAWLDVERLLGCFDWLGGGPLERYAEMVGS